MFRIDTEIGCKQFLTAQIVNIVKLMSPRNKNNEMDAGDFGSRKGKSDINVEL